MSSHRNKKFTKNQKRAPGARNSRKSFGFGVGPQRTKSGIANHHHNHISRESVIAIELFIRMLNVGMWGPTALWVLAGLAH